MDKQQIVSFINENMFGIWFLIGAALVFWMQAGFAMVETGFTRAKNAGNILMKNLMDFCIGTVMFILIGFSLLLGEDVLGFIGKPGFDIFSILCNYSNDCIRCYGRAYKILILLYLFRSNFGIDLSD